MPPRDGQGGYLPPLNNWNPAVDGNEADPAGWNQLLADLTSALSQSVSADGQTMLTGNLKMGGNTLQGMGAPAGNGQALRRDQLIKGPNIPSSATVNIPNEGSVFEITGTTTITQLSGAFDGRCVILVFQSELQITHGPNLQLPNATDITTKAGDAFLFYRRSSSVWACFNMGLGTAATRDVGTGPDDVPTNGLIFATFAEISALTEDHGPIICTDQDGILYAWEPGANKYIAQTADNETALAKSSPTNLLTPAALGFSLQPHIEGSAAFTSIDNQIVLTGIVPSLALEVGDVIEITGSTSNNRLHTVESITDDDTIIVNYEHRNGAGSLSLVDEATNVTIKRIAKWYAAPIGLGQAWVELTGLRVGNTNYANTTQRTITVFARLGSASIQNAAIYVDGVETSFSSFESGSGSAGATAPVNAGAVYRSYAEIGVQTANSWAELR